MQGMPEIIVEQDGGGHWTVPELLFESKKLMPAIQQLLTGG
jgi:hypothetical protein